jgi:hypothetical protein
LAPGSIFAPVAGNVEVADRAPELRLPAPLVGQTQHCLAIRLTLEADFNRHRFQRPALDDRFECIGHGRMRLVRHRPYTKAEKHDANGQKS